MKNLLVSRYVEIPKGVNVWVKSRKVTVRGPRGQLVRDFKHLNVDARMVEPGKTGLERLKVDMWTATTKQGAVIRTFCSHIQNMITGVTKGFRYKMRFAYAHFPITVSVTKDRVVEVRNFIGEKRTRYVQVLGDCSVVKSEDVKDQLVIEGNDINDVSLSAALVHQSCLARNKDIRKFLDGIYVSESGAIGSDQ